MSAADERRSEKIVAFLQDLESYITELAKTNHDVSNEAIVGLFKQNFNRSMLASAEFHEKLVDANDKVGDMTSVNFHKLHAEIYRLILIK
jgi:hypothetical protein